MSDYLISDALTNGDAWMTCIRRPNGLLRRVVSNRLPLRPTREEAERDLVKWLWHRAAYGSVEELQEANANLRRLYAQSAEEEAR